MRCKNCETEFDEGYICPACGMRNDEDKADKEWICRKKQFSFQ